MKRNRQSRGNSTQDKGSSTPETTAGQRCDRNMGINRYTNPLG